MRLFLAAIAYAGAVFAAGFVLGALRVAMLAPRVGELNAVLIETPAMLAISWLVCGPVMRRFAVPAHSTARLGVGALALAALLALEALTAVAFGASIEAFVASYRTAPAQVGLAAQVVFALMPWIAAQRP